jgi:hypothetical protein
MRNLGVTPSTAYDLQAAAAAHASSTPYTPIMPMTSLDALEQQLGQAAAGAAGSAGARQHQLGHTPFYTPLTAARFLPGSSLHGSSMTSPSSAAMPSPASSMVFDNQLFASGPDGADV